jgi:hypothetical protein
MNIKDLVKNKNIAKFDSYRCGIFYYIVAYDRDGMGGGHWEYYQFQIPVEDLGNATLKHTEKAITLMRYIRKSMKENTLVKVKNEI